MKRYLKLGALMSTCLLVYDSFGRGACLYAEARPSIEPRIAYGGSEIIVTDLDGSNPDTLISGIFDLLPEEDTVTAQPRIVYNPIRHQIHFTVWVQSSWGEIRSVGLDGTYYGAIQNALDYPIGLAVDVRRDILFWGEFGGVYSVLGSPLGTSANASYIAVDPARQKVYWSVEDGPPWQGQVVDYDGTGQQSLPGLNHLGFVVDESTGYLYWLSFQSDTLYRFNPTESQPEPVALIPGGVAGSELHLDPFGKKLYWYGSDGLYRADIDGTNVELVVQGKRAQEMSEGGTWCLVPSQSLTDAPMGERNIDDYLRIVVYPSVAQSRVWFEVPNTPSYAEIGIYDVRGRLLRILISGSGRRENQTLVWDLKDDSGREVSPGAYFARVSGNMKALPARFFVVR